MFRPSGSVRLFVIKEKQFSADNRKAFNLLTGGRILNFLSSCQQYPRLTSLPVFDLYSSNQLPRTHFEDNSLLGLSQEISTGKRNIRLYPNHCYITAKAF